MELHPSSQTEFFKLHDDMQFAFEPDESGNMELGIKGDEPRRAARVLQ